ncbi:MAG: hypothetical protein IJW17_06030 [Lentisphaeria bacterium]|nr:hypothetical protein [Lentisphaeria bacterium]
MQKPGGDKGGYHLSPSLGIPSDCAAILRDPPRIAFAALPDNIHDPFCGVVFLDRQFRKQDTGKFRRNISTTFKTSFYCPIHDAS